MKLNLQQMLNTFIRRVNGKGRSLNDTGECIYVPAGHPGCAIGCQFTDPEDRAELQRFEGRGAESLLASPRLAPTLEGVSISSLRDLQHLHDNSCNWTNKDWANTPDLWLKPEAVQAFCDKHELVMPVLEGGDAHA